MEGFPKPKCLRGKGLQSLTVVEASEEERRAEPTGWPVVGHLYGGHRRWPEPTNTDWHLHQLR